MLITICSSTKARHRLLGERPNELPISRRARTTKTAKIAVISRAQRSAAWAGWAAIAIRKYSWTSVYIYC